METKNKLRKVKIKTIYEKGRRKIQGSRVNVIPTNCVQNNFHMLHPTMKDVKVIKRLILASSKQGDTILDPFLGSGTTMLASLELGRSCIGMELEPKYIQIAKQRLNWGNSLNPEIEWEFKETN